MKVLISILVILSFSFESFSQKLDNPVKLDEKDYYFTKVKKLTSKANPKEGPEFIVPDNAIWLVDVTCDMCYVKLNESGKYITNSGYIRETEGNIAYAFLPVVLYENTKFVIYSNTTNTTNIITVEEYKMK